MTSNRSQSSRNSRYRSRSGRPLNYQRQVSVVHLTPMETKLHERQKNALLVPKAVLQPGSLPVETQDRLNMHQMKGGEQIFWKQGSKAHFSAVWLDENWTRPFHEELRRLQELILRSPTSENLSKDVQTGGMIHLSISTKLQHRIQSHRDFLKKESSKHDPRMQEMVRLSGSLISKLFRTGLPPDMATLLERRSALEVSLGAGHEDNVFTSHVQANISLPEEDLPTAIGAGGGLHMDGNNDAGRLSIVFFLSHLPEDYCPGKFILPSESVYCMAAPYTAIICSGHLPHWPIPPAKYEDSSIRYVPAGSTPSVPKDMAFRRISVVSYPEKTAMKHAPLYLTDELLKPESLFVYGTKRNQHEFWARLEAKKTADTASASARELDDGHVSQIIVDNCWYENGEIQLPRSSQIKEILFGDPDDDDEWEDRVKFIHDYISCGFHFPGGHRKAQPILTDLDGVKDGANRSPIKNGTERTFTKSGRDRRPTKNRDDRRPIKDIKPSEELPASSPETETDSFDRTEERQSTSSGSESDHLPPLPMNKQKTNDLVKYFAALEAKGSNNAKITVDLPKTFSNYDDVSDNDLPTKDPPKCTSARAARAKARAASKSGQKRKTNPPGTGPKRTPPKPLAYIPKHTPKRMDLSSRNNRSRPLSKRDAQDKYDRDMKNLMDLVVDNAISLEEYDAQVQKLGKLKAQLQA